MRLFGRMTTEECVREAYDTFTEDAQPYLFPNGEADAVATIEALGEACGLREKDLNVKRCEDLLDLWAEMVHCTELNNNRAERIRLMRKKYGRLVPNERIADCVCNWCEKKLNARFGVTMTDSGMTLTHFPENELPQEEETEEALPSTDLPSEPEVLEEAAALSLPDPKTVAKRMRIAKELNGPERKQMLESLKPHRKEWLKAVMAEQKNGARGAVGSIFLAGFVAAGGKTVDKAGMRSLLKQYLENTGAEEAWPVAEDEWKRNVLKAAWQLGARMGAAGEKTREDKVSRLKGQEDQEDKEENQEDREGNENLTEATEDEKV